MNPETLLRDPFLCSKVKPGGFLRMDVLLSLPQITSVADNQRATFEAVRSSAKLEFASDGSGSLRGVFVRAKTTQQQAAGQRAAAAAPPLPGRGVPE